MTRRLLALAAAVALVAVACGDDDGDASVGGDAEATTTSAAATTTTTEPPPPDAAYKDKGPYEVGVSTVTLADGRLVEVYYPAADDAADVSEPAKYDTTDPLSEDLKALVPEGVDLTVAIDGYRDAPRSADGPFPMLMFSHGFGAFRNLQSALLAGIASHGLVVSSIDHNERGLLAVATEAAAGDGGDSEEELTEEEQQAAREERRAQEVAIVVEARDAVLAEFGDVADGERVAAAGHSAGGGTVLALHADDGFDAVIGWASAGAPDDSGIPTMLILAENDIAIPPEEARPAYDEFPPPKAFVNVLGAGHNSFTDTCANVQGGRDLLELAVDVGFPIPDNLLALGRNGCEEGDLAPDLAFEPIQHFTVAWALEHTGSEVDPGALDESVVESFEAGVEFEQEAA